MTDYRSRSMWLDGVPGELAPRDPLPGPIDVDVAVVGAGLTGLWTAYYLKKADPHLRIAVLEREIAGFGASGRNGGWCSSFFAGSRERTAKTHGRAAAIAMQKAMFETVDEVGRVVDEEGIDARFHKGGVLVQASTAPQLLRVRDAVAYECSWGFGEEDYRLLSAEEARSRIAATGSLGAYYTPHCACVDPARLARGLADVVERLGVPIYERTPALRLSAGRVETPAGTVTAEVVVRATEAYTVELPGFERVVIPLYSLMIATEPLPGEVWDAIGWREHETFNDERFLIIYAMRTDDDRLAIGGRGAPYHWGSRISDDFDRDARVFSALETTVHQLFPQIGEFAVTHTWGGPIGVPRDWYSSVGFDPATGRAWAGGYVGDGVATTNLAGRTLRDLIRAEKTEVTGLPWVGHRSPLWEPEPLRWLAVNAALKAMASADAYEERTGRPSRRATPVQRLIGA
ncbi:MAG TPA: FAD-dependent oxidoreductase [Thermoleophilia bacterium]|nr:FAD-dependent oxidoreductase [Thermoleophilia bacterium]